MKLRKVNKEGAKVLEKLYRMLKEQKGSEFLVVHNGEFMAVHVEYIGMTASGGELISVAHYGEQNGDLMRDPEMVFLRIGKEIYYPTYFRNDYAGVERECVVFDGDKIKFDPKEQREQAIFAGQWMKNIKWQQNL